MNQPDALPGGAALVVFDVCDTLYHANTTLGFLRHIARQSPAVAEELKRWTSRWSPFYYLGAATYRLAGFDLARERLVTALRDASHSLLEAAAREYVDETLPAFVNPTIHDRLRQHQRARHRVVLISNSLDIVVAPIADALGTEFRASTLGFREDACTGKIDTDLTGRKAEALRPLVEGTSTPIWVYTDNRGDRDILALADRPVIVLPRNGEGREWGGPGYEYVRL